MRWRCAKRQLRKTHKDKAESHTHSASIYEHMEPGARNAQTDTHVVSVHHTHADSPTPQVSPAEKARREARWSSVAKRRGARCSGAARRHCSAVRRRLRHFGWMASGGGYGIRGAAARSETTKHPRAALWALGVTALSISTRPLGVRGTCRFEENSCRLLSCWSPAAFSSAPRLFASSNVTSALKVNSSRIPARIKPWNFLVCANRPERCVNRPEKQTPTNKSPQGRPDSRSRRNPPRGHPSNHTPLGYRTGQQQLL